MITHWRTYSQDTEDAAGAEFITAIQVLVNMHWRLRPQPGAFCKGDALRVFLAMPIGGTLVLLVMLNAPPMCWCNHHDVGSPCDHALECTWWAADADSRWLRSPRIMQWRLRSQDGETVCASCKGEALSVNLAILYGWHLDAFRQASHSTHLLGDELCADLVRKGAVTASLFC